MSKITDEHILELVRKVREKDEYAYAELYKFYFPKAVRVGEKEVYDDKDKAYVPNIVNDVFLKIWGIGDKKPTILQLDDDSNFENWLYRSVKWAIQDYARKEYGQEIDTETGKKRIKQKMVDNFSSLKKDNRDYDPTAPNNISDGDISIEDDSSFDLDDERFSDADKTFFSKRDEIVRDLVSQLSDKEKEVVNLYFFTTNENGKSLTLKEVGEQLGGLSTSTVNSRLDKAQNVLKGIVEKYQKEYNVKLYSFTPAMLWYLVRMSGNAKELFSGTTASTIASVTTAETISEAISPQNNVQSMSGEITVNKPQNANLEAGNATLQSSTSNQMNSDNSEVNPSSNEQQSIPDETTSKTAQNGSESTLEQVEKTTVKEAAGNSATASASTATGIAGISAGTKIAISIATAVAVVGGGYAIGRGLNNKTSDTAVVTSTNEGTSTASTETTTTPEATSTPTPTVNPYADFKEVEVKADMIKAKIPNSWTVSQDDYGFGTVSDGKGGTIKFDILYPDDNGYVRTDTTNDTSEVTYGNKSYQCLKHYSLDTNELDDTVYTAKDFHIPFVVLVENIDTESEEFTLLMESVKYKPLMTITLKYNMNVRNEPGETGSVIGNATQGTICFVYQKLNIGNEVWYRIDGSDVENVAEYNYGYTYICGQADEHQYVYEEAIEQYY